MVSSEDTPIGYSTINPEYLHTRTHIHIHTHSRTINKN